MAVFSHTVDVDTERSQQNLRDLEDATRRATNELARGEGAARRFGDAAGQIGTAAGRLGGLLGRINPQFEEQARLVNDVADAAEVAASGWGKLGPVLARIGITGPIAAVGIAALGTAAVVTANQTGEARAELEGYQETIERTRDTTNLLIQSQNALKLAQGDVTAFVADLRIQTALLNGEISDSDIAAGQLGGKLADALRPRLLEAGLAVAETTVEITRLETALNSGKLNAAEIKEAGANLEALKALLPTLNEQLQVLKDTQAEGSDAINEYAAALDAANDSTGTLRDTVTETIEEVRTLGDVLADVDVGTLGRVTRPEEAVFVQPNTAAQVDALAAQAPAEQAENIRAAISSGLSAAGAGLDAIANPASALGLLGPAGGVLQGLNAIGGLGAEGVGQQLDDLLDGIVGGIEALPQILVDVIPAFVIAVLTELPGALLGLIPNLVSALIEAWRNRRDNGVGGTEAYAANPEVQALLEAQAEAAMDRANPFGAQGADFDVDAYLEENRTDGGDRSSQRSMRSRAATTGRMERARGAARLSMSRSATARGMGAVGVSIQVNQLGPADATQDSYLRTLAQLQDQTTGLRG